MTTLVNSDVRGWAGHYVLPYFVAAMAGGFGAVSGLAIVEHLMPTLRSRPVVWTFIGIVVLLYAWTILGIWTGDVPDKRMPEMVVQAIVASITAWKVSGQHDRRMAQNASKSPTLQHK